MFNRNMLLQMAVSALIFFLVFRFLSFLGVGFVILVLAGIAAWYLFFRKPELVRAWSDKARQRVAAARPAKGPSAPPVAPEKPLNEREREAFEELERNFRSDDTGGEHPSPRR